MKKFISKIALQGAALAACTMALTPAAMAGHNNDRLYQVKITNATLGQPLSPSVIATHTKAFQLFELGPVPMSGDPGYDRYIGLATVAETGYPNHLLDAVAAADGVWEAVALPPYCSPASPIP